MPRLRSGLFWAAVAIAFVAMKDGPMGWIFPMAAAVHRLRRPLAAWLDRRPLAAAFIGSGLSFGLLTESFAIAQNLPSPPERRILLHPTPAVDLVFAVFYYGFFMVTWWLLRRRFAFSKKAVFLISGLFGLATEQGGAILANMVPHPVLGGLLALLVMSVYGIFPVLALLLTEHRWPPLPRPRWHAFLAAAAAFFLFWAVYGLVIHRLLLRVFPK